MNPLRKNLKIILYPCISIDVIWICKELFPMKNLLNEIPHRIQESPAESQGSREIFNLELRNAGWRSIHDMMATSTQNMP